MKLLNHDQIMKNNCQSPINEYTYLIFFPFTKKPKVKGVIYSAKFHEVIKDPIFFEELLSIKVV